LTAPETGSGARVAADQWVLVLVTVVVAHRSDGPISSASTSSRVCSPPAASVHEPADPRTPGGTSRRSALAGPSLKVVAQGGPVAPFLAAADRRHQWPQRP
jgi:hypothetical protein